MPRLATALCFCLFVVKVKCATCPASNCGNRLDVNRRVQSFTSPCYPSDYQNSEFCSIYFEPQDANLTQMVFWMFKAEAWHDYLKLRGPTNFILYVDPAGNRVFVTGIPSGNITAEFVTDSGKTNDGFTANMSAISPNDFLVQYAQYANESAMMQILGSPLYISSVGNPENVGGLDIMFMNLPNGTGSPASIWANYTDLAFSTAVIEPFDITPTGFSINWTAVEGAVKYNVLVTNSSGGFVKNVTGILDTRVDVTDLPSGTSFSITLTAMNKLGSAVSITGIAQTAVISPADVSVLRASQTSLSLNWSRIDGAIGYEVNVTGLLRQRLYDPPFHAHALLPGHEYSMAVVAVFELGRSSAVTLKGVTVPGEVSNFTATSTTNTITVTWKSVHGAEFYVVRLKKNSQVIKTLENAKSGSKIGDGVRPGTRYNVSVAAANDAGESEGVELPITTAVDGCEKTPCLNGGACNSGETDFTCTCTTGYQGKTCEKENDLCEENSCGENADCTSDAKNARVTCNCRAGFTGDPEAGCVAFCKAGGVTAPNKKMYNFNFTSAGQTVYSNEKCNGDRSKASVLCKLEGTQRATFQSNTLVVTECNLKIANVTIKIEKNASTEALENQSGQLQTLTSSNTVTNEEVNKVTNYIEEVSERGKANEVKITETLLRGLVNTADNLITTNSISQAPTRTTTPSTGGPDPNPEQPKHTVTKEEKMIKKKILESLTNLAELVVIPNDTKEVVIETKTMVVKVVDRPKNATSNATFAPVLTLDPPTSGNGSGGIETVRPVSITIPAAAIKKAEDEQKGSDQIRLSFFLHKDDTLFPSDDASKKPKMIISANLGTDLTIENLDATQNVRYSYDTEGPPPSRPINKLVKRERRLECSFWNVGSGAWSTYGCWTDQKTNDSVMCKCNHLTNFALIVAAYDVPEDVALDVFSMVGIALSMTALVLTMIIHCIKQEIRKRRPTQILLHICGNLLVTYIIFEAGVSSTEDKTSCIVVTAFLQYFFLASWCWMTVYAYDMYGSLVVVLNRNRTRYLTKCAVVAYGLPLLITVLSASIAVGYIDQQERPNLPDDTVEVSAYIANNMCWLRGYSLYFGFLLPVGLMLLFNIFVYTMVIRNLTQRGQKVQSSAKQMDTKDHFMISVTITAGTGLTWVIGYFMLLSMDLTFQLALSWIFSIFNTIQGVIIFLTTCVRHENMRKIWWHPIRKRFRHFGTRVSLMSPKRKRFSLANTTETGTSYQSTTGGENTTKATAMHSIEDTVASETVM